MNENQRGRGRRTKVGDPLTAKQHQVLEALRGHQARYGMPPTLRQLSKQFGFAFSSGSFSHIRALMAKGYVRQVQSNSSRCYVPVESENRCPACGQKLKPVSNGDAS